MSSVSTTGRNEHVPRPKPFTLHTTYHNTHTEQLNKDYPSLTHLHRRKVAPEPTEVMTTIDTAFQVPLAH